MAPHRLPSLFFAGTALIVASGIAYAAAVPAGFGTAPVASTTELASTSLADDAGGALFDDVDLMPGRSVRRCVTVSYAGDATAGAVRLQADDVSGALVPYLGLKVEVGTGGGYGDCTGFTGNTVFDGPLTRLAGGTPESPGVTTGWRPTGDAARTFAITARVADDNAAQNKAATATVRWLVPQDVATESPTPEPSPPTSPPVTTSPPPSAPPTTTPVTKPPLPTAPVTKPTIPVPTAAPVTSVPSATPGSTVEPTTQGTVVATPGSSGSPSPSRSASAPAGPGAGPEPAPGTSDPAPGATGVPGSDTPADPPVQSRLASWAGSAVAWAGSAAQATGSLLSQATRHLAVPLFSLLVVLLFFLVQNRIDRRDPKLALAPMYRTTYLYFTRRGRPVPDDEETQP